MTDKPKYLAAAWFPDRKRMVYVEQVERHLAPPSLVPGFDAAFTGKRVPVVWLLDTETRATTAIHIGLEPQPAADGRSIFIKGAGKKRLAYDLATGKAQLILY